MAKDEKKEVLEEKKLSFKERKLKAINEMQNKAKAKIAADRVLSNQ